ncbi:MAG: hypothetical protein KY475_16360, partial [Planctomycetes bacterium]|nr:hypothetical protein [Planctomycetota bacterium]
MNIAMRPEQNDDGEAIWNVNRAAFETDAEAHLVDALRQAGFVEISLVAQVDGALVGHILFRRAVRGGSNSRHRSEP